MTRSIPTNYTSSPGPLGGSGLGSNVISVPAGNRAADIAKRLPEPGRAVFLALADRRDELHALSSAAGAASAEAAHRASQARRMLEDTERDIRNTLNPGANSHNEIEKLKDTLAAESAEWSRCAARGDEASSKWRSLDQLYRRISSWLESLPRDRPIPVYKGSTSSLKKGETVVDRIENCRHHLRRLRADRHAIESAPISSAAAKAIARKQIAELAMEGEPDCMSLIEIAQPLTFKGAFVPGGTFVPSWPLVAWAMGDALLARIDETIARYADDKSALDDATRAAKLKQIASDILATEREECAFVSQANQEGIAIQYRGDTDPRALLGLSSDLSPGEPE